MGSFLQQPIEAAAQRVPEGLRALRQRGESRWRQTPLPTRRSEAWKYTSLAALRDDYRLATDAATPPAALPAEIGDGFGGARLVFVDGVYQPTLSDAELPAGVHLVRFSEANAEQAARIAAHLDSAVSGEGGDHPFAALSSAALSEGVFLEVDDDAIVDAPIHCLWLLRAASDPVAVLPRLLVRAGRHARASIVEHFAEYRGAGPSFSNAVTELLLEEGAVLAHYRLHEESGDAIHVGGVHARLAAQARLESFHLATGSRLKRFDVVVHHDGPGAHATLNGVYLPRGEEHIDYHTCIEHAVPHCSSDETFRGIIADRATAVFNGRIHIHPQAQKTRAEMSNRNLLTSAEAEVNTKPELEIYADDVQCAHGATVAQLDEVSLHYLRTRGVSREEAEVMLSFGFINELIDGLALAPLREYLRRMLATRFARNPALSRHLL
jgi:Fe-S cluster assembly protein SufD